MSDMQVTEIHCPNCGTAEKMNVCLLQNRTC